MYLHFLIIFLDRIVIFQDTWLKNQTKILFTPAWDFGVDAQVHAQGALTRNIENGYTLVRNARFGLLTVTSPSGEVLGEASGSQKGASILLVKNVPVAVQTSFYSQHPDRFIGLLGVLDILLILLVLA